MSIEVKNLSFTYSPKSPYEKKAIKNISFSIAEGETVAIVGSTGSGKSTLIQHLNGLIKLKEGSISVCGINLNVKKPDYKTLRSKVGMLFQYPEYQLFEETILKDVCFAPLNFGLSKEEAIERAKEAIQLVGLNFQEIKDKSPFEISGGQKRRAAIAGVIAAKPEVLILDEPTAGLDPKGKRDILELIKNLKKSYIKTVIIISHNMDEIAEYTDRVLVLSGGELIKDCKTEELFKDKNAIASAGLTLPHTANIASLLTNNCGFKFKTPPLKVDTLVDEIISNLGGRCE